ncbi:MAG: nitronate monooxygenase [Alicyclobacillus sp.]|nr:nitronate monooxygenase [Alicyclobacillus sp.]
MSGRGPAGEWEEICVWRQTALTRLLGIEYPIIQAGMAGGPTTPALVAAVSEAGGLGSIGAGYLTPDALGTQIEAVRGLTARPFCVNLFVPQRPEVDADGAAAAQDWLNGVRERLGLSPAAAPSAVELQRMLDDSAARFDAQVEVAVAARVPVIQVTFGAPEPALVDRLHDAGIRVLGSATSVSEAIALEAVGVDAITVQGSEAGGHRGTFLGSELSALVGTMALVPQAVDRVRVPVVAAGGIMDGRGIVAALALGASGVQMGTAFLACAESGAHPLHKAAVLACEDTGTVLTNIFSGKLARGIRNELTEAGAAGVPVAPYPIQNQFTQDIRKASAAQRDAGYLSMWAGQAAGLARSVSAAEQMAQLVAEVEQVLGRIEMGVNG